MSLARHIPSLQHAEPSAAANCVRFLEAMEAKHPHLFAGSHGKLEKHKPEPSRRPPVTQREIATMVRLYHKGQSCEEIAAALGRCTPSVYQHLAARGLRFAGSPRPMTAANEERMVRLFRAGETRRAIAKALGCSRSTVRSRLQARGLLCSDRKAGA